MWAFGETVTVRRQSSVTQDADGNDVPMFTNTEHKGVAISPSTTVELLDGQNLVVTELHAIWQPGIPLKAEDQVDIETGLNAGTYYVDGDPKQYRSPMTSTSVTDAKLKNERG